MSRQGVQEVGRGRAQHRQRAGTSECSTTPVPVGNVSGRAMLQSSSTGSALAINLQQWFTNQGIISTKYIRQEAFGGIPRVSLRVDDTSANPWLKKQMMSKKYRKEKIILVEQVSGCKLCSPWKAELKLQKTAENSDSNNSKSRGPDSRKMESSLFDSKVSKSKNLEGSRLKSGKSKEIKLTKKRKSREFPEGVSDAKAIANAAETAKNADIATGTQSGEANVKAEDGYVELLRSMHLQDVYNKAATKAYNN